MMYRRKIRKLSSRSRSSRSRSSRSRVPAQRRKIKPEDMKFRPDPPSPESNSLLENITKKCHVKSEVVQPAKESCNEKKDILVNAFARTRCVDFDQKGVCLRGELCPFDHGSDPIVLHEIMNKSGSLSNFTGELPCDKPMPMNFVHPRRPLISDEYYPENPSILLPPFGWSIHRRPRPHHLEVGPFLGRGGMVRPAKARHLGPSPRQLITVPVDGIRHRGAQSAMTVMPENPFAVGSFRMVCRAPSQSNMVQQITKPRTAARAVNLQRKQEMMTLLNAQIQEQKTLIAKLESDRSRMTKNQRDEILKIIKNLQNNCEELKVSIANIGSSNLNSDHNVVPSSNRSGYIGCPINVVAQTQTSGKSDLDHATSCVPSSRNVPHINGHKEEMIRKLLDAELALYMCERKGHKTIDLEKKILQMRAEEVNDVSY